MRYTLPFVAILLMVALVAADSSQNRPLPAMSNPPWRELAPISQGVLVGQLTKLGVPGLDWPSKISYSAHWKVIKVLRGTYPSEAHLGFDVRSYPFEKAQRVPTVGTQYILITTDRSPNQIAYMFDYTDEMLREIQDLLAR
jgi:hypothetical protein